MEEIMSENQAQAESDEGSIVKQPFLREHTPMHKLLSKVKFIFCTCIILNLIYDHSVKTYILLCFNL